MRSFGIPPPLNVRDADEIERGVASFARSSNGGLILSGGNRAILHRDLIINRAARYKLPAIYADRFFAYPPVSASSGSSRPSCLRSGWLLHPAD